MRNKTSSARVTNENDVSSTGAEMTSCLVFYFTKTRNIFMLIPVALRHQGSRRIIVYYFILCFFFNWEYEMHLIDVFQVICAWVWHYNMTIIFFCETKKKNLHISFFDRLFIHFEPFGVRFDLSAKKKS